eukprot:Skav233506  [mRNA]  locus=scaffold2687:311703:312324:- [translate_table: standard]
MEPPSNPAPDSPMVLFSNERSISLPIFQAGLAQLTPFLDEDVLVVKDVFQALEGASGLVSYQDLLKAVLDQGCQDEAEARSYGFPRLLGRPFELGTMAALATVSGVGLLEHPGQPEDLDAASIWAQPLLRFIADLPGMRLVRALQGLHGAISPQPTDLLALDVPSSEKCLQEWKLTTQTPKGDL